ncbi:MarR family winged helix-turn-helix transcriptional regulator [Roseibium sp. HPY-6]|uniref:MarR family winged helix-turn-helix transcriptional regulator n=1 Tax=Roseibium sp. HPY-6 TaxID=3229852 RepID=UPI00338D7394
MSQKAGSPRLPDAGDDGERPVLELNRFLPYQLNHLAETVSRSFSKIYAEKYGIGIPEWRVIAMLGERGAMTARDISVATSMHKTKVSRAVAALENRDFVIRVKNPEDMREQTLRLTATGTSVYEDLIPKALAYSNELQSALTSEQRLLLNDVFERLHEAVKQRDET